MSLMKHTSIYIEQNPLKMNMVKTLETYPYSSYNYFFAKEIPECLKKSWIVQNHGDDLKTIIGKVCDDFDEYIISTKDNKTYDNWIC